MIYFLKGAHWSKNSRNC